MVPGCKREGLFAHAGGKLRFTCEPYYMSCPAARALNAQMVAEAHAEGRMRINHLSKVRAKGGPANRARNVARRAQHIQEGIATYSEWRWYTTHDHPELHRCDGCGIGSEYNGKPLTLQTDHRDGNPENNNQRNLRWLCPNCHTQTPTWGKKAR